MRVFLAGEKARAMPRHVMFIAPAADTEGEAPADWLNEDGTPKNFTVEFRFGEADVPSNIGKYLVARGMAQRTKLILPTGVMVA